MAILQLGRRFRLRFGIRFNWANSDLLVRRMVRVRFEGRRERLSSLPGQERSPIHSHQRNNQCLLRSEARAACWVSMFVWLASVIGCGRSEEHENSKPDVGDRSVERVASPPVTDTALSLSGGRMYSKVTKREGEVHYEGIVDARGRYWVPFMSELLVQDITDERALVQYGNKFLFVPLGGEAYVEADFQDVDGFQYAMPYRCGLAVVVVNDRWFYINESGERAFQDEFEFAESFCQDCALVKQADRYRLIDTQGRTIADLDYDSVSPQSEWCWQVTDSSKGAFKSGFIDRRGQLIGELEYDEVGYFDPNVNRIRVGKNGLYGFLDERASVVIPIEYEYAEVFDKGRAKVVRDGREFEIDPDGHEISLSDLR